MREAAFIKKNKQKWDVFEALLITPAQVNPDEAARLFTEITNDLSYAQTYYPKSQTTLYLNGLAAKVYQRIYRNKKERTGRIKTFWTREVPEAMYANRKNLLAAFLIFLAAVCIGILSARYDTGFVRLILGDHYVNRTIANIESGEPMGIYGSAKSSDMFILIAINNIRVSLYAFAAGIVLSIGTLYILLSNGIMLGAFQYFFIERDLFLDSALAIWTHGTLEIWAIIVAGAAGFALGNSFLMPGTYMRAESFRMGAKRGLKILIGLVPVFIMAAFFEGYLTRHSQSKPWLSAIIIAWSLIFIIWYYIYLPYQLAKQQNNLYHGNNLDYELPQGA